MPVAMRQPLLPQGIPEFRLQTLSRIPAELGRRADRVRTLLRRLLWLVERENHGSDGIVYSDGQLLTGQHLLEAFGNTRVLDLDPEFVNKVVQGACQLRRNHPAVLLGASGTGLFEALRNPEEAVATDPTSFRARAYELSPRFREEGQSPEALSPESDFVIQMSPYQLERAEDAELNRVILIEPEVLAPDVATSIRMAYSSILNQQGIVADVADVIPSTVIFVMSLWQLRQAQDESNDLSYALRAFDGEGEFPVAVIPVVSLRDGLHPGEAPKIRAAEMTSQAFADIPSEILEPVLIEAHASGHAHEAHARLRQLIFQVADKQLEKSHFREIWLERMAEDLVRECKIFLQNFPDEETEWALFKASRMAMAKASNLSTEEDDGLRPCGMLPPWESIPQLPRSESRNSPVGLLLGPLRARFIMKLPCGLGIVIFFFLLIVILSSVVGCYFFKAHDVVLLHRNARLQARNRADAEVIQHFKQRSTALENKVHSFYEGADELEKEIKELEQQLLQEEKQEQEGQKRLNDKISELKEWNRALIQRNDQLMKHQVDKSLSRK